MAPVENIQQKIITTSNIDGPIMKTILLQENLALLRLQIVILQPASSVQQLLWGFLPVAGLTPSDTQFVAQLDDLCLDIWVSVMSQHPDNRETGYSNVLVTLSAPSGRTTSGLFLDN